MKHSRRNKLTVDDIQHSMRLYNMDVRKRCNIYVQTLIGYRNNPIIIGKQSSTKKEESDEMLIVEDILNAPLPELPVETSFEVDWLVVKGKQVSFNETCIYLY